MQWPWSFSLTVCWDWRIVFTRPVCLITGGDHLVIFLHFFTLWAMVIFRQCLNWDTGVNQLRMYGYSRLASPRGLANHEPITMSVVLVEYRGLKEGKAAWLPLIQGNPIQDTAAPSYPHSPSLYPYIPSTVFKDAAPGPIRKLSQKVLGTPQRVMVCEPPL